MALSARNLLTSIISAVIRNPGSFVARKGYIAALMVRDRLENCELGDLATNGEQFLIDQAARLEPAVVIDCGLNNGEWMIRAIDRLRRDASSPAFHAFEIIRSVAADAEQRIKAHLSEHGLEANVTVNACGLSDRAGSIPVWYSAERTDLSSASWRHDAFDQQQVDCPVTTGDDYCRNNGIDRVDVLKIDAEGHEWEVLAGFTDMLEAGSIRVVQWEHGSDPQRSRYQLEDFLSHFGDRFALGKLFSHGVYFFPEDRLYDDVRNFNYIAVSKEEQELIEALSRPDYGHYFRNSRKVARTRARVPVG